MSRVRYSTNWMGVASIDWYRENGLTEKKTVVLEKDSTFTDHKKGDTIEIEDITTRYSCGRIDFWNPYDPESMYPDEMGVPPMISEDWERFSNWLDIYETDDVLTLEQLVYVYELKNPKIRWHRPTKWQVSTKDENV
jgi:hypothetical protein